MNSKNSEKRVYQNFLLDSTHWDHIEERPGDVIVATPYKCGTTWMQNIVLHLIHQDLKPRVISDWAPWIDNRLHTISEDAEKLKAQKGRRCMKSHLPRDGTTLRDNTKYIVVGRDPRDVFMSFWNHYSSYTPEVLAAMNDTPGRVGPPLMPCPEDIRCLWNMWINTGWFDWESEGYPHWSNFRHVQTWWDDSTAPNILMVHFNDLLADLSGEITRIAEYLEIDLDDAMLAAITEKVTFKTMKRDAEVIDPDAGDTFAGGAQTFFNKGTNGRWRGVLTDSDLAMYEKTAQNELSIDCRNWLENGRLAIDQ